MNQTLSKASDSVRLVLLFIGGQGVFVGAALIFLYVTANTLFLIDYGPETLPYVYLAVGGIVSLTFYGYAELQRRWSLPWLILATYISISAFYFLAWFILQLPNTVWVSFALMVFFFFAVQLFFVTIGAQVGRLLDVRQLKRFFPLIMAAATVAFIVSSLSVSVLLPVLDLVENLLLLAGVSMLLALVLSWLTIKQFRPQLTQSRRQSSRHAAQSKPLAQLMRKRYVASIFSYQFLSAIGSQLTFFLLMTLADARYSRPDDLARFFGNFAAGRNIINVLFMMLAAGRLMSRFGLQFGLTANPVGVGVVMAMMVVASAVTGQGPLLFWLAVVVVALDVILSESMTSTALKAVYQSLPAIDRPVVETGVEGIGVPVAFGVTGVLLLLFNAISGLNFTHLILFTTIIVIVWTAAGSLVYRDYARALLKTLSRRVLGEVALSLDDESSLTAVESLVQSHKLSEVRLGLDMLSEAEHGSLEAHLVRLLDHPEARIRAEALTRLEQQGILTSLPAVEARLHVEAAPEVKGAAVRALCALKESDAVEEVTAYLDDLEPEIRLGAMVGLLRYGGISGVLAAGERLTALKQAANPADRLFVAHVIGEVQARNFYEPLPPLLADETIEVRKAALVAAGRINHPRLLPAVIDNLAHRRLRSPAMAALVGGGQAILPIAARALAGETDYDEEDVIRLVRACGYIKGEQVIALLKQHLNHPDDDVQFQVLAALDLCGFRAKAEDWAEIEHTLHGEVEHGLRVLLTRQEMGQGEALASLHRALDYEFDQARKRVFLLLSFLYNARAILRAGEQLRRGAKNVRALALETLDVTLPAEQKALVFPLVDESRPLTQRTRQLNKLFSLPHLDRTQRLEEIIADPAGLWTHGWTRACAIYAAAKLPLPGLAQVIEGALAINEHPVRETAAWALYLLAPDRYKTHAGKLSEDTNPNVAHLAAHLNL